MPLVRLNAFSNGPFASYKAIFVWGNGFNVMNKIGSCAAVTLEAEAPKMDEACKVEKCLAHKNRKAITQIPLFPKHRYLKRFFEKCKEN